MFRFVSVRTERKKIRFAGHPSPSLLDYVFQFPTQSYTLSCSVPSSVFWIMLFSVFFSSFWTMLLILLDYAMICSPFWSMLSLMRPVTVPLCVQSYLEVLNALVTLQNSYLDSKNLKNLFQRYSKLRSMIKVTWKKMNFIVNIRF
jgi:hypothetical protein